MSHNERDIVRRHVKRIYYYSIHLFVFIHSKGQTMELYLFIIFLSTVYLSYAQTIIPTEWEVSQYYNPQTQYQKCGRSQKSLICDPNGILTVRTANHLDHILNGTYYNDIPCPCSQHKCRFYKNGYAIAVALVKKLKVKAGEDKTEKAKKFALSLVREKWRFGECDNNVVILYSADDGVLYTVTGTTAAYKLTDSLLLSISQNHFYLFDQGDIGAGLYSIITDYREVLKGTYVSLSDKVKSQTPRGGATQIAVAVTTLLAALGAALVSQKV